MNHILAEKRFSFGLIFGLNILGLVIKNILPPVVSLLFLQIVLMNKVSSLEKRLRLVEKTEYLHSKAGLQSNRGRVIVLIDGDNIEHSASEEKVRVNYALLKNILKQDADTLVGLKYYTSRANQKNNPFLNAIKSKGYALMPNKLNQKNLDTAMLRDLFQLESEEDIDTVVILSGDGNAFCEQIPHLKASGKRVEVYGFNHSTSKNLKVLADLFRDIRTLDGVCELKTSSANKSSLNKNQSKTPKSKKNILSIDKKRSA